MCRVPRAFGRGHSRVVSRNVERRIAENGIVSIAAGTSTFMLLLFIFLLRSSLLWEDGFSRAGFFHHRDGNETVSSALLAAVHGSLICCEELLSERANHQLLLSGICAAHLRAHFRLHQPNCPNPALTRPDFTKMPLNQPLKRIQRERAIV